MLTNFPAKKIYNTGGYQTFRFVPYDLVLTYPMINAGNAVVPVSLYGIDTWLTGYATPETLSYVEEGQRDVNGVYYNLTVAGFVPGDKAELIDLMVSMEARRHIVIASGSDGYQRLIGSPSAPLDFLATFNSGTAKTDQKGFSFQFTGQSLYRAPLYAW